MPFSALWADTCEARRGPWMSLRDLTVKDEGCIDISSKNVVALR